MSHPYESSGSSMPEPIPGGSLVSQAMAGHLQEFVRQGGLQDVSINMGEGVTGMWGPDGYAKFALSDHPLGSIALEIGGAEDLHHPLFADARKPESPEDIENWGVQKNSEAAAAFCITDTTVDIYRTTYDPTFILPDSEAIPTRWRDRRAKKTFDVAAAADAIQELEDHNRLLTEFAAEQDGSLRPYVDPWESRKVRHIVRDAVRETFSAGNTMLIPPQQISRMVVDPDKLTARLVFQQKDASDKVSPPRYLGPAGLKGLDKARIPVDRIIARAMGEQLLRFADVHYPKKIGDELRVSELNAELQRDIRLAMEASEKAYPRNKTTRVGCVISAGDGESRQTFWGANLKRDATKSTTCAERMALDQATAAGMLNSIDYVVVYGTTNNLIRPCGSCRGLLDDADPSGRLPIIMVARDGETAARTSLRKLYDSPFHHE